MNSEQAKAVALDMERHGWNTLLKMAGQKWTVKAIDAESGTETTIRTPAEWEALRGETVPVAAGGLIQAALL